MALPVERSVARRLFSGLLSIVSLLGIAALFGVGATVGVLGHLNLPAGRRATAALLGKMLADLFQGQVTIGSIAKLSPEEIVAEDVVVRDQDHRIVLKVTRLAAQADVLDILSRLVRGDQKLTIVVNHVRVDSAEADIVPAADGLPTLAHAFMPRPKPASAPSTSSQYVRVWLPEIEIGHAFARGRVGDSPTLETELTAALGSVLATPKGAAIDVNRFALVARGVGGADAKGVATLHIRAPGAVWCSFDGYIGDVQFGSAARWEKQALDLKVDLPRAEPGAARALLAQWPLLVPAEARLHLRGKPPDLDVDLQADLGENATLTATGNFHAATPLGLELDVEGRKLDLRALWAKAPATSIDIDSDIGLHTENGKLSVELGGALQPTSVGNFQVPAVDFSGTAVDGGFTGEAKLHDLGLPVNLGFTVHADGKIEADAEARRVNLAKVERIKPYFDGSGNADMRVHATLDHGRLDATLTLDVRSLAYQGIALQSGRLTAGAKGSLDKLDQLALDARITGKKLTAGRFAFDDVKATARGPLRAPAVTAALKDPNGPSFDASAKVGIGDPVSVRELSIGVSRDNVEIRGDVAELDLAKDRVLIRDLSVHGATGELSGNAELTPQTMSVTAHGKDLDLSAFSRVLGLPRGVLEGRASMTVDAAASGTTQRGSLELSVSHAAIANLNGISGQLSAKLEGAKLSGASTGTIEGLGAFSSDWDTQLDGPPIEAKSFERAIGEVNLQLSEVTLDYLGQLLPSGDVDVGGQASFAFNAKRTERDAVPDLKLSAQTQGLSARVTRKQLPPFTLSGIELMASATHDGASGNTSLAVSAEQGSERLVTASADVTLDLKAALEGKQPLVAQLDQHPILAKAVINRLDLESLPASLRPAGLRGAVRVEGTLRGSLVAPVAALSVRASDLRFASGERGEPIDACGTAEYAKESGAFNVGAELFLPEGLAAVREPCGGKRIATVQVRGQAPFDFSHGLPAWSGTASASLTELPLATIPQLADARMTGTATGTLILDHSGQEPNASAQLQLVGLKVDHLDVGDGSLKLRSDATHARAEFGVERSKTSLKGSVDAGVSWASQLPAVDDKQPIDLTLRATQLDASVLEPFLSDFVNELHGVVDGDISARLDALAPGEETRHVDQVGGRLTLGDGSLVLTGLGFRLRDVSFSANATRDGKTTLVEIPDLVASAGTKVQNLKAYLKLRLAGFQIVSGSGSFNVDNLPIVVDGITRANANANVKLLTIDRNADRILVDVPFDVLTVRLPDESSRQLIDLSDNEAVKLLQPIAQPKAARDDTALPWQFAIHLGGNAKVQRGEQLDIPITGDPNVVLADGVGVTGSIVLPRRGAVQMLGRMFQIEGGAVVFDTPDPKDPRLDVRASWRSSTNDTLFMYISGTISKPKVQFDRPQADALALLAGTTENGTGAANISISALDSLLADTPLARVQLRGQDSTDTATKGTTYTAAYRASDRVIVEGNYQAASSENPQYSGTVGAAVDLSLTKTVSVRGQLGTIGTGVDLVYQYRY